ncbi:MAG: hypothetical protein ACLP53_03980 [Isosphaeraceae bacterium]
MAGRPKHFLARLPSLRYDGGGREVVWDRAGLKAVDDGQAQRTINPERRAGWAPEYDRHPGRSGDAIERSDSDCKVPTQRRLSWQMPWPERLP